MESKKWGNKSMSRSVVPLVVAFEDEYGSTYNVPETNKTLQNIRKHLNKTIVAKSEVLMGGTVTSLSRPWVLINKKTGERYKFNAFEDVESAIGLSMGRGYKINEKESQSIRLRFYLKNKKQSLKQ